MAFPDCFQDQTQFDDYMEAAQLAWRNKRHKFDCAKFDYCCDCTIDYKEKMMNEDRCSFPETYFHVGFPGTIIKELEADDLFQNNASINGVLSIYKNTLHHTKNQTVEDEVEKTFLWKLHKYGDVLYISDLVDLLGIPGKIIKELEADDLFPGDTREDGVLFIHKDTMYHFLKSYNGRIFTAQILSGMLCSDKGDRWIIKNKKEGQEDDCL